MGTYPSAVDFVQLKRVVNHLGQNIIKVIPMLPTSYTSLSYEVYIDINKDTINASFGFFSFIPIEIITQSISNQEQSLIFAGSQSGQLRVLPTNNISAFQIVFNSTSNNSLDQVVKVYQSFQLDENTSELFLYGDGLIKISLDFSQQTLISPAKTLNLDNYKKCLFPTEIIVCIINNQNMVFFDRSENFLLFQTFVLQDQLSGASIVADTINKQVFVYKTYFEVYSFTGSYLKGISDVQYPIISFSIYDQHIIVYSSAQIYIYLRGTLTYMTFISPSGGNFIGYLYIKSQQLIAYYLSLNQYGQVLLYSLAIYQQAGFLTNTYFQNKIGKVVKIMYDDDSQMFNYIDQYGNYQNVLNNAQKTTDQTFVIEEIQQGILDSPIDYQLDFKSNVAFVYNGQRVWRHNYNLFTRPYQRIISIPANHYFQIKNQEFQQFVISDYYNNIYMYQNYLLTFLNQFTDNILDMRIVQREAQIRFIFFFNQQILLYNNQNSNFTQQTPDFVLSDYKFKRVILQSTSRIIINTADNFIIDYDFFSYQLNNKFQLNTFEDIITFLEIGSSLSNQWLFVYGTDQGRVGVYDLIAFTQTFVNFQQPINQAIQSIQIYSQNDFICLDNFGNIYMINSQTLTEYSNQPIQQSINQNIQQIFGSKMSKPIQIIQFDMKFQRYFVNFKRQSFVSIFSLVDYSLINYISFPDNEWKTMVFNDQYLILSSTYQLNIHQFSNLSFIGNIRRYNRKDRITDIKLIENNKIIVVFVNRIESLLISFNSVTLVDSLPMIDPQLIYISFNSAQMVLNYIGVAKNAVYEKRIDYGLYENQYPIAQTQQTKSCYFQLQYQNYIKASTRFQQVYSSSSLSLMYLLSVYINNSIDNMDFLNQSSVSVVFRPQSKTQNNIQIQKSSFDSLNFDIQMDSFNLIFEYQNIQLLLTNKQYLQQDNTTIVYSKDTLVFDGAYAVNNTFPSNSDQFNIQNILLLIQSSTVNFTNIQFKNNTGNIQFISSQIVLINKSVFQNNIGVLGGCLSILQVNQSIIIKDTNFQRNQVSGSGGSIYLNNVNYFSIDSNSLIKYSSASIGGAIRIINKDVNLWKQYDINCLMLYNSGEIYGDNIGTFPMMFLVQVSNLKQNKYEQIFEGQLDDNISQGTIIHFQNIQSGGLFPFRVQLQDQNKRPFSVNQTKFKNNIYEQSILQELNSYFIQVAINQNAVSQNKQNSFIELKGEALIGIKQYDEDSKMFNFESLTLTSLPHVNISSVVIQFSFDSIGYSKQIQTNISFRSCQVGEILVQSFIQTSTQENNQNQLSLISCTECTSGTYSLTNSDKDYKQYQIQNNFEELSTEVCKQCPPEVTFCQGNTLILQDGYWRFNNQTDEILKCNYVNPNICSVQNTTINGCIKGYIGPLCEKCDTTGAVWKQRYAQPFQQYECDQCSDYIVYIFFFMERYIYESRCNYLRIMKFLPFSRSCVQDESSYYIKLLINYLIDHINDNFNKLKTNLCKSFSPQSRNLKIENMTKINDQIQDITQYSRNSPQHNRKRNESMKEYRLNFTSQYSKMPIRQKSLSQFDIQMEFIRFMSQKDKDQNESQMQASEYSLKNKDLIKECADHSEISDSTSKCFVVLNSNKEINQINSTKEIKVCQFKDINCQIYSCQQNGCLECTKNIRSNTEICTVCDKGFILNSQNICVYSQCQPWEYLQNNMNSPNKDQNTCVSICGETEAPNLSNMVCQNIYQCTSYYSYPQNTNKGYQYIADISNNAINFIPKNTFQSAYQITCHQFFNLQNGGTHLVFYDSNSSVTVLDQNLKIIATFSVSLGKIIYIKSFQEGVYLFIIQLNQMLNFYYYSILQFDLNAQSQNLIGSYFTILDIVQFKKSTNNLGQNIFKLFALESLSYTSLTIEVYYNPTQDSINIPFGAFIYAPTQYVVTATSNIAQNLIFTGSLIGQLRVAPAYNDRAHFQIIFNSISSNSKDQIKKVQQSFRIGQYFVLTSVINCFSLHTDNLIETINFSTNVESINSFYVSEKLKIMIAYISTELIVRDFTKANLKYSLKLSQANSLLKKVNGLFLDEVTSELFLFGDGLIKISTNLDQQILLSSKGTLNSDNYIQCIFPSQIIVCLINKQNLIFFDRLRNYVQFQSLMLQDLLSYGLLNFDLQNQQIFVYKTYIEVYSFSGSYLNALSDVQYPIITFSVYDNHIVIMSSAAIYIYQRGSLTYISLIQPSGGAFTGCLYIKSQNLIAYYTITIQYGQILLYSLTTYQQAGSMSNTYQANKIGPVVKIIYDDDSQMFNYIDTFGNFQNVLNNAQKTTDQTFSIEEIQSGILPPPIDYILDFQSNSAFIYNNNRVWRQNYNMFTRPYQRVISRPSNHYFQINTLGKLSFIIADQSNNIYMYQNNQVTFQNFFSLNILDMRYLQKGNLNRFIFFFNSQILIYNDQSSNFSQQSPDQLLSDYSFKRILFQKADRIIINTADNFIIDYDFFAQQLNFKFQLNPQEDIISNLEISSLQSNKWQYIYGTDQGRVLVQDMISHQLSEVQFTQTKNTNPIFRIKMYNQNDFICLDNVGNVIMINGTSLNQLNNQPIQQSIIMITQQLGRNVILSIDTLDLSQVQLQNNIFPLNLDDNNTQNILILIKNTIVKINQMTYEKNEGNVQFYTNDQIVIENSNFLNNKGVNGGCIYVESLTQIIQIQNSTFMSNYASGSGGSIYLKNVNQFYIDEKSQLKYNNASIGGAIRIINQDVNLWYTYKISCQLLYNYAELHGNNIGTLPLQFLVEVFDVKRQNYNKIYNGYLDMLYDNTSINFQNVQSAGLLRFRIQLLDHYSRPLSVNQTKYISNLYEKSTMLELNSYFIQVAVNQNLKNLNNQNMNIELKGEQLIGIQQYDANSKMFNFESLTLESLPLITISSVIIQFSFNNFGFSQQIKTNISFRSCYQGEILVSSTIQVNNNISKDSEVYLISCVECSQGKYSLSDPAKDYQTYLQDKNMQIIDQQICKQCPPFVSNCYSNILILEDGYWRSNNQTDQIVGCNFVNPDICSVQNNTINGCITGYIGPICEKCDSTGEVWGDRYVQSFKQYECDKCSNQAYQYIVMIFMIAAVYIYLYFSTFMFMGRYIYESRCTYLRFMKILPFSKSCIQDESSYYIKVLLNYLQLSSILFSFYMKFIPTFFTAAPSLAGSPSTKLIINTQCLFTPQTIQKYGEEKIMIIGQSLFPLVTIIFFYILLAIQKYFKFQNVRDHHKYTMFNVLFLFFQPDCIFFFTKALSCRQIGSQKYQVLNILLSCDDQSYRQFSFGYVIPNLAFWILIPAVQFYNLRKQKGTNNQNLDQCIMKYKYGLFYSEYKNQYYYWEIVRMYLKVVLILIANILNQYEEQVSQICIIILFWYIIAIIKIQPFKSKSLQKIEFIQYLTLIPCIFLFSLYRQHSQPIYQAVLAIIHYSYIGYMIFLIARFKLQNQNSKIIKIIKLIIFKLSFGKIQTLCFDKNKKNERVLILWRKVYSNLIKIRLESCNKNLATISTKIIKKSTPYLKNLKIEEHEKLIDQILDLKSFSNIQSNRLDSGRENPVKQYSKFKKEIQLSQDFSERNLQPHDNKESVDLVSSISQHHQNMIMFKSNLEINPLNETKLIKKPKNLTNNIIQSIIQ
ncbi:transmembrane protein, putative (macronuclear) [Tetrahymena thermophila SB210]|uniref:Transmembrane protein, putative n=1 Tax=Tetrahymena thermophila (strain SB210) TaxID=312017 RepID=W7WZC6_TETTS|nr:transmembrane protein, putative [Tetrahymena thermophila SB210]EWS70957.1 transmembrane protein, putative [Tetrahymena thermophila SB210]|eukprot:XP_012656513.1 transmembrane protein, putative [Tetrahymena thermophila SB210]